MQRQQHPAQSPPGAKAYAALSPQHNIPQLQQSPQQSSPSQQSLSPSSDWKEMLDPKSAKRYWVNHVTKQMSYNPPAEKQSPPRSGSDSSNLKGALGLSRLDELLDRYEKITAQNREMQRAQAASAAAQQEEDSSPAIIKTEPVRAQRAAAPLPPSSTLAHVSPPSIASPPTSQQFEKYTPTTSPHGSSETARLNFARTQANKIPNAVDLLETYIREPNALKNLHPSVPNNDPSLHAYGLSMFVDNYAPDKIDPDNSFRNADAILADLQKFLNNGLLLGDLGSTRQIGDNTKKRTGLAAQAVDAGKAKATRALPPTHSTRPEAIVEKHYAEATARALQEYADVSSKGHQDYTQYKDMSKPEKVNSPPAAALGRGEMLFGKEEGGVVQGRVMSVTLPSQESAPSTDLHSPQVCPADGPFAIAPMSNVMPEPNAMIGELMGEECLM